MTKRLFERGQSVICINDDFSWARKKFPSIVNYPIFGSRYIVRNYVCGGKYSSIVLREFINPDILYFDGVIREAGFWQGRFIAISPPTKISVKKPAQVYIGEAHEYN